MAIDVYLQIEGTKGESTDSAPQGWIEISQAQWGVTQPVSSPGSGAGGRTTGRSEYRSMSLAKLADLASPALMQHCSNGKTLPKNPFWKHQYPHPIMMQAILRVSLEWQSIDRRRIGIGNISRADGFDDREHGSHKNGLQVDIRPLRKDGLELPLVWNDEKHYDRDATAKVIELFRTFSPVKFVLFNDTSISFVKWTKDHDDHFHVVLIG